jgi:hypothetical protein
VPAGSPTTTTEKEFRMKLPSLRRTRVGRVDVGLPDHGYRPLAERVLGHAATPAQLDELFGLCPIARVTVSHDKAAATRRPFNGDPFPFTRATYVVISAQVDPPPAEPRVLAGGEALLNPADTYSRQLGTTIAFGRALKKLREQGCSGMAAKLLDEPSQ